jgi:hypothetical protein
VGKKIVLLGKGSEVAGVSKRAAEEKYLLIQSLIEKDRGIPNAIRGLIKIIRQRTRIGMRNVSLEEWSGFGKTQT